MNYSFEHNRSKIISNINITKISGIHVLFIRKIFMRKWAAKTLKPILFSFLVVVPSSVSVKPIKQVIKENKDIEVKKKIKKFSA